jgi:hypothetical protein
MNPRALGRHDQEPRVARDRGDGYEILDLIVGNVRLCRDGGPFVAVEANHFWRVLAALAGWTSSGMGRHQLQGQPVDAAPHAGE